MPGATEHRFLDCNNYYLTAFTLPSPVPDADMRIGSMRAYSPPVTRLRARAIVLGEAAQKDQHGQQEREQGGQAQAQQAPANSARIRRRDHRQQQQHQQQSAQEELLSDRGGARAAKEPKVGRRGAGSGFSSSREADARPVRD